MGLTVAIVGFNYEQSKQALFEIATNDVDASIKYKTQDEIRMSDGTRYVAFPTHNHVRGWCIDQVIVADDDRWNVFAQQYELLDWLQYRMVHSCVPDEFRIQRYEW